MNRLLGILFVTLTILVSVTASNGGTYELTKLLENRDFWATYKWETFEDSELFKSTTWKLRGASGSGGTKTSENYTTPVRINNFNTEEMNMYVNYKTKEVNSFDIYSLNKSNADDYTKLVSWCNEKFGDVRVENKRTDTFGKYVRETATSSWAVDNTIVRVRTENNLSNGPKSVGYITTLSFAKNYPSQVIILNEGQPKKMDHKNTTVRAEYKTNLQRSNQTVKATIEPGSLVPAPRSVPLYRPITPALNAVNPTIEKYLPPPYIWEDELGTTHATNDIQDVPENKRAMFEITLQK